MFWGAWHYKQRLRSKSNIHSIDSSYTPVRADQVGGRLPEIRDPVDPRNYTSMISGAFDVTYT